MVDEPNPGSFYWVLLETHGLDYDFQVLKSAQRSTGSFDAALEAGAAELRLLSRGGPNGPRHDYDYVDNPSGWTPLD